ncbi:hypothetical protein Dsin_014958 [Dipteronia sinensis]|uniref:Uncharacterized protein n=1 Tax=Dipteronia sinensis TaxID=43782 RepID=A0AAE0EAA6_9ROSI|nr:hypothetical protein Dsin_014958 [Dipteronia sinensis]
MDVVSISKPECELPLIQLGTTRQKFKQCKVQSATLIKANDSIKQHWKCFYGDWRRKQRTCWNFEIIQAREIIVNFIHGTMEEHFISFSTLKDVTVNSLRNNCLVLHNTLLNHAK